MRGDWLVCDADGHVVEGGGLFDRWVAPGTLPMAIPATTPLVPCGDLALVDDQMAHGFDAPSYLRAMDAMGVDAAVLYPSLGLYVPFLPALTPAESADACRAYNEWAAAFCATDPTRLAAAALVPLCDPGAAAKEAHRAADLGLIGVVGRPNRLYDRNLGDPAYDPLYAALAERALVLAVHEGLGLPGPPGSTAGRDRFDSFAAQHACSHPMEQQMALASLVFEGALERHPDLLVALLESGTGWLPWWLHRLDEHHEWVHDTELAELSLRPSEYFARQCTISSEADDALASFAVASVGEDHVMWASDFPHPDAVFPGAVDTFLDALHDGGTPERAARDVLWDTPVSFYGLDDRFTGRAVP